MSKFNEQILLVMRWLQNPDSVTKKELDSNYHAAWDAYAAYRAASAEAASADYDAAAIAAGNWIDETKHSLEAYFKLTKEDRKAYEERVSYLNVLGANNA